MQKVIFRGKSISTKQWVYGDLWQFSDKVVAIAYKYEHHSLRNHYMLGADWEYVDPQTVGQWTYLVDMQSKPVFTGDIIKGVHVGYDQCEVEFVVHDMRVAHRRGEYAHHDSRDVAPIGEIRGNVIGNIYDKK